MVKWKSDFYLSIVLVIFSCFVFQQTFKFPVEAALFPRIFSAMLAILGFILLGTSLRRKGKDEIESKKHNYQGAILIMIGLVIYAVILKILGYIISTFLLIIYVISILGYKNLIKTLLTSAIGVSSTYIVFKIILGVRLPNIFLLK